MLKGNCINPELIRELSKCGHGSKILIADGNYPLAEKSGQSPKIYLGLRPGIPTVTDVLESVHSLIKIEAAQVMLPEDGSEPEIFDDFREELGAAPLIGLSRAAFYKACMSDNPLAFSVSTGEKRIFANILITVGCV